MSEQIKKKRKSLSFSDKLNVINKIENGQTQATVSKELGIPPPTVSVIWKGREKIKSQSLVFNVAFKKARKGDFPTVDSALLEWFNLQRARNIPLNGPLLLEKAHEFARLQNIEDFKGSEGWIESWKRKHGLVFKRAVGEAAAVNEVVVTDWIATVWPTLKLDYAPRDIFNTDETGLFYRLLPDKTLEYKGKECHGGKLSKERLTVLLCANSDGSEKLKPLVIGKSAKPRCFKNLRDLNSLPVSYQSNKKAWMTSELFTNWLLDMDKRMKTEKRKILLLLDNCPPHVAAKPKLEAVKLVFLPPNVTSRLQPLDCGIINSFKVKYRTEVLKKVIMKLDAKEEPKIDVLEAIFSIASSWRKVTADCIANCFKKAKITTADILSSPEIVEVEIQNMDLPPALNVTDFSMENYAAVDSMIATFDEPTEEEIAASHLPSSTAEVDCSHNSDESDEEGSERENVSTQQALKCLNDLKFYVTCHSNENALPHLETVEKLILDARLICKRQSPITDYYFPVLKEN